MNKAEIYKKLTIELDKYFKVNKKLDDGTLIQSDYDCLVNSIISIVSEENYNEISKYL